jgi:ribosomal protein S6
MTESGIFFTYTGLIDYNKIDILLKQIKKTREFKNLHKTTGKKVYSVIVECLENIVKHSVIDSNAGNRFLPFISAEDQNKKIIVKAGNLMHEDKKEKVVCCLDKLNKISEEELKALYERIVGKGMREGQNGAGLGYIIMKMKSGNKIEYSFSHIGNNLSFFEIQISINKYIMRKLIIEETAHSPKVILDPDKKIFEISGESRPPDVREFYDQILTWLDDFSLHLVKSGNKSEVISFDFNFEYFNSSSGKLILDICKILATLRSKEFNIIVNWHFEKDDFDMLEVGKEMSKIVKFPFEYIQTMG